MSVKNVKTKKPKKLSIQDANKLFALKDAVDRRYKVLDKFTDKMIKKYGVGEAEIKNPHGEGYIRLSIKDHLAQFKLGEPVFKATGISRFEVTIKEVKHGRNKEKTSKED